MKQVQVFAASVEGSGTSQPATQGRVEQITRSDVTHQRRRGDQAFTSHALMRFFVSGLDHDGSVSINREKYSTIRAQIVR